jgi:hypothetical protein
MLAPPFMDLEETAMVATDPDRLDDALMTLRRRRNVRVAAAAAVVVAVALAAAAFALLHDPAGSPIASTTPTTGAPATAAPTITATASPGLPAMTILFTGERPQTPLGEARLDVPSFDLAFCAKGPTQFTAGRWSGEPVGEGTFTPAVSIDKAIEADVDRDGDTDVVALLVCRAGTDPGGISYQVDAFTRTANGWATLGRIALASGGGKYLHLAGVAPDGTVTVVVQVAPDIYPPISLETYRYRWTGAAFAKQGSPTIAKPDLRKTRIELSAEPLRLSGGKGTLTISIRYVEGPRLDTVRLGFWSNAAYTLRPSGAAAIGREQNPGGYRWWVTIAGIAPGETVTGSFEVSLDQGAAQVLGLSAQGAGEGGTVLDDLSPLEVRVQA